MPLRNGKLYLKRPPTLTVRHLSDNVVIITNSYQQELPDAAKVENIDQSGTLSVVRSWVRRTLQRPKSRSIITTLCVVGVVALAYTFTRNRRGLKHLRTSPHVSSS